MKKIQRWYIQELAASGWTRKQIADRLGVGRGYVNQQLRWVPPREKTTRPFVGVAKVSGKPRVWKNFSDVRRYRSMRPFPVMVECLPDTLPGVNRRNIVGGGKGVSRGDA